MNLTIIVDRVGKTNVFNVIKNDAVATPFLNYKESLVTDIDGDLIDEYLHELARIANVSRSLSNLPRDNEENQALIFQHLNLNEKLRQIGEVFFRQFFPAALQNFLKEAKPSSLFLHLDPQLASIPFELLHDSEQFLWQKFYIGKNIKGGHVSSEMSPAKENLNILIVADPTEDLEWARQEGEMLFEDLSSYFSDRNVNIELLGGKSVTKLSLLNAIVGKDIIHYCGHLYYSGNLEENGWVLANNKIVHAREIKNSGAKPLLYFSNSCVSASLGANSQETTSQNWYADFASSFLQAEATNYIGTNWEIKDNRPTIEFTLNFYRELLKGSELGRALNKAREISFAHNTINDLTWSSYLLMGNPAVRIFESEQKIPDITRHMLDYISVFENMPYGIAESFWNFCNLQEQKETESSHDISTIPALFDLFQQIVFFLAALVFANFKYLRLPGNIVFDTSSVSQTIDSMYQCLRSINNLKTSLIVPNLLEVLFIHKENLAKIVKWKEDPSFAQKLYNNSESFQVTIQYMLENMLIDLEILKIGGLYRIMEPGHRQYSLRGLAKYHALREILLPTQTNKENLEEVNEKTQKLVGMICFYNPIKKIFLNLSDYIEFQMDENTSAEGEKRSYYRLVFKTASDSKDDPPPLVPENFSEQSSPARKKTPSLVKN